MPGPVATAIPIRVRPAAFLCRLLIPCRCSGHLYGDGHRYAEVTTSSDSVSIDNTLPSITASISANGTTNTGVLTCSAVASDADDQNQSPSISYEWFDGHAQSPETAIHCARSSMGVDGESILRGDRNGSLEGKQATRLFTSSRMRLRLRAI